MQDVYETSEGKKIYNENLEAVGKVFPQYLLEIKGMANGANVSFHKVHIAEYHFLLFITKRLHKTMIILLCFVFISL